MFRLEYQPEDEHDRQRYAHPPKDGRDYNPIFGVIGTVHGVFGFHNLAKDIVSQRSHRSWRIKRVDAHHWTATGTGIVGKARGEAYGNVFHLEFTLDLSPGNSLARVHMSQGMYLQPDGRTMINRDVLTKGGVVVARITEQFTKGDR